MRHERYDCDPGCPLEAALEALGGKWKGLILFHLKDGTRRFNELRRLMPTITQRTLARQLRELEADRIVSRTLHAEVPPRVEYRLTDSGRTLIPILDALREWGQKYLDRLAGHRSPPTGRPDGAGEAQGMGRPGTDG